MDVVVEAVALGLQGRRTGGLEAALSFSFVTASRFAKIDLLIDLYA